jgi:hypothetical protein
VKGLRGGASVYTEVVNGTITGVLTFERNDGIFSGTFTVTITAFERVEQANRRSKRDRSDDRDSEDPTPKKARNLLPEKYSSPETSRLSFRVERKPSQLKIDLND